jgi:hypothetical protein
MKPLQFISFGLLTFTLCGLSLTQATVKEIPLFSIYDINGKTDNLKNISNGKITQMESTACLPECIRYWLLIDFHIKAKSFAYLYGIDSESS